MKKSIRLLLVAVLFVGVLPFLSGCMAVPAALTALNAAGIGGEGILAFNASKAQTFQFEMSATLPGKVSGDVFLEKVSVSAKAGNYKTVRSGSKDSPTGLEYGAMLLNDNDPLLGNGRTACTIVVVLKADLTTVVVQAVVKSNDPETQSVSFAKRMAEQFRNQLISASIAAR